METKATESKAAELLKEYISIPCSRPDIFYSGGRIRSNVLMLGFLPSVLTELIKGMEFKSFHTVDCSIWKDEQDLENVFKTAKEQKTTVLVLLNIDRFGSYIEGDQLGRELRCLFLYKMQKLEMHIIATASHPVEGTVQKRFDRRLAPEHAVNRVYMNQTQLKAFEKWREYYGF